MKLTTERLIIHSILNDHEFFRKAGQFIKTDHFEENETRVIYSLIEDYVANYTDRPSNTELKTLLNKQAANPEHVDLMHDIVDFEPDDEISTEWMLNEAEEYCKDRAIKMALMESLDIIEGKSKLPREAVSDLMDRAINFKFDADIGLNFYEDIDRKVAGYQESVSKIPFKLAMLNKITNGGFERKTVNVVAAPTGFGKSIWLGDEAVFQSKQGFNTVYLTFEMSDDRISRRMDANANDMTMDDLRKASEESLRGRFVDLQKKKHGYLILKEFGPGEVTAAKIRLYLKEVEMTLGEPADVVCVDYLNLMASARFKSDQTYMLLKGVCEELVQLAKKNNIAVLTATQFNRGGQKNSSPEIKDISESQAVANTVDFLLALFDTEELEKINRAVGKQLKNRYGDKNFYKSFLVGIERAKMTYYDVSESESIHLADNVETPPVLDVNKKPIFDKDKRKDDGQKFTNFDFD